MKKTVKVEHVNFYENLKEAQMRLRGTVVVYDKEPYYIWTITDHKKDGIFRVYMSPLEKVKGVCPDYDMFSPESPEVGKYMDKFMEDLTEGVIIRKHMNSPLFNKFRPFPLGMCNTKGANTFYVERQPNRRTEQGLTRNMVISRIISPNSVIRGIPPIDIHTPAFRNCVVGEYPEVGYCLEKLKEPKSTRESVGFHREFALCKGPLDQIYLAYKDELVGVLSNDDFSCVTLPKRFHYAKEVVSELNLFYDIKLR